MPANQNDWPYIIALLLAAMAAFASTVSPSYRWAIMQAESEGLTLQPETAAFAAALGEPAEATPAKTPVKPLLDPLNRD